MNDLLDRLYEGPCRQHGLAMIAVIGVVFYLSIVLAIIPPLLWGSIFGMVPWTIVTTVSVATLTYWPWFAMTSLPGVFIIATGTATRL